MENKYNQRLFWYGFRAKVKEILGSLLTMLSVVIGIIVLLTMNVWIGNAIIFLGGGLGLYLVFTARAKKLDYEMQTGTIIHRGEW